MDEARSGPGWESGSSAMGEGGAIQSEVSANPGLRQQAMDTVRGAREQVTTQVRERAGTARDSATRMVDERKRTLADSVHALASAFDAAAASLSDGQQARMAEWSRELSGRAHRIASYLEQKDTRGLVNDLEGTAREHPTAFLGSTFAAGLAAGRFLRSSTRTDTGLPMASDQGVDFEFHPDAALLADDSPEAASFGGSTTGYTSSGSTGGFGSTGSTGSLGSTGSVGSTGSTGTPGSTGATGESFGSRLGETPAAPYSAGGNTSGAAFGTTGNDDGRERPAGSEGGLS